MTDQPGDVWLSPDDVHIEFGERVRRGYDPDLVDRHLDALADGVRALRREVESAVNIDDESLQVMMRAGRRSVEEALEEAREKADSMVSEAEAKSERILSQAHAKANQIRAAGDDEVRRQEETIEIRRIEIEALDEEIALRQKALRAAAAELLRLADGIVDDDHEEIDLRPSEGANGGDVGAGAETRGPRPA
jgi:DivIVA domain-containing protein